LLQTAEADPGLTLSTQLHNQIKLQRKKFPCILTVYSQRKDNQTSRSTSSLFLTIFIKAENMWSSGLQQPRALSYVPCEAAAMQLILMLQSRDGGTLMFPLLEWVYLKILCYFNRTECLP